MKNHEKFGPYLRCLLKKRGVKPQVLADMIYIDHSLVRKWLAGSRVPSLGSDYYNLLCRVLDLDMDEQLALKKAQINSIDDKVIALTGLLRKAESRADAYQQALVALVNAIPEAALLLDQNGRIVAANKVTAQRLGITGTGLVGQEVFKCFPPEIAESRKRLFKRVVASGLPLQYMDHRDTRWLLNNLYPVKNSEGFVSRVAVCVTDITEKEIAYDRLRASEERHRLIFENSLEPILLTKPGGIILAANPAACCFLDMSEKEICAAGRNGILDSADENLAIALAERDATGRVTARLTWTPKNGPQKVALATSVAFRDSTGGLGSYVMIHPDRLAE